jgi:hypothetical protein
MTIQRNALSTKENTMTYEEYLDEVTTLLHELYELDDEAAIKLVVDAQADDFFVAHDEKEDLRTIEQANKDAVALYERKQNKNQTQRRQQLRAQHKK